MTQYLITEPVKLAQCTRCNNPVIHAVTGGLTTITDVIPLTVNEEIAVIMTGRTTFDLQSSGIRAYLEWRDITRIRAGRRYPVVAAHQCGPGGRLAFLPAPASEEVPDDPPF
jgi:hypothetical protein